MIPTTATLLGWAFFHSKFPSLQNWVSLAFVLVAVTFLTRAERKRALELKVAKGIWRLGGDIFLSARVHYLAALS